MNVEAAKYFGYALQLLLVLVLVISLACKSWGLLIVCLVAATALLAMVCYQLIKRQDNLNYVKLVKTKTMSYPSTLPIDTVENMPVEPLVPITPMTPMMPATYQPPIHRGMTRDEQAAMHLMSMTDRGVSMHAPVRNDFNQYIVPNSQGLDLHPHTNAYLAPATAQAPLPVHLDEMHPDNPMNSLSYLRQS
jgi:hypothetical protein